jgi:SAM-dependent methyltransferase
MVMSSEQLSRWLKNRIRVKAAKFVAVLGLEVSIREGPPSDMRGWLSNQIPDRREWLSNHVQSIEVVTSENVLEVGPGSWAVPRDHFVAGGANYVSVDPSPDGKPTLVGSHKDISKFGIQFDTILVFETLEHVAETSELTSEIYANLKPGGRVFASVPFKYHLHGEDYGDYYRFTRQGLRFVMREFELVEIYSLGEEIFPKAYFLEATKAS